MTDQPIDMNAWIRAHRHGRPTTEGEPTDDMNTRIRRAAGRPDPTTTDDGPDAA